MNINTTCADAHWYLWLNHTITLDHEVTNLNSPQWLDLQGKMLSIAPFMEEAIGKSDVII